MEQGYLWHSLGKYDEAEISLRAIIPQAILLQGLYGATTGTIRLILAGVLVAKSFLEEAQEILQQLLSHK